MKFNLTWIRGYRAGSVPRDIKPIGAGSNTVVFDDFEKNKPDEVIVFMIDRFKLDWWHKLDLVIGEYDEYAGLELKAILGDPRSPYERYSLDFTIYRMRAKRLYKLQSGTPQFKQAGRTVKAAGRVWDKIVSEDHGRLMREYPNSDQRISLMRDKFWHTLYNMLYDDEGMFQNPDLQPIRPLVNYVVNWYAYDVSADLSRSNVMQDGAGNLVFHDMACHADISKFARSKKTSDRVYTI